MSGRRTASLAALAATVTLTLPTGATMSWAAQPDISGTHPTPGQAATTGRPTPAPPTTGSSTTGHAPATPPAIDPPATPPHPTATHLPSAPATTPSVRRATPPPPTARRSTAAPSPDNGHAPTRESLRQAGPHDVETMRLPREKTGTGFADVVALLPTHQPGPTPTVVMMPGLSGSAETIRWVGERLASHGYAAFIVEPPSMLDGPAARGKAVNAAAAWLISSSPWASRLDGSRIALYGYSMGAGGVLEATDAHPHVRAVVSVFPWDFRTSFPSASAPTLVLSGSSDITAPKSFYATPIYRKLTGVSQKAFAELAGATHTRVESPDARLSELTLAWLGRFLLDDPRYDVFLCPGPAVGAEYTSYQSTCPW
ncbi:hypothetical protein KEM60_03209 [Austwickia sp. TVS 96-490-7B]|uniref:poly(ethylene terephthalate) hydrolase family protein n=1 Tax=Austwickia sp. TVS 96-490-7B TaxID=2830843 RepID=UPI001C573DFB|nr:dienelactone hydrolase family protein [Austwickia sp. TVS 96-490-7B]MBW3086979.1 hypothetical protein [Austwickia sp. TVS 96-490-7B]